LRRHLVSRKEPIRSGASCVSFSATGANGAGTAGFLRLILGVPNMSGAKNPACNANSANACPDGSRQLIGSIHSMGIRGIRTEERLLRPAPKLRGLIFCDFILFGHQL
jgi:hypothetical protein